MPFVSPSSLMLSSLVNRTGSACAIGDWSSPPDYLLRTQATGTNTNACCSIYNLHPRPLRIQLEFAAPRPLAASRAMLALARGSPITASAGLLLQSWRVDSAVLAYCTAWACHCLFLMAFWAEPSFHRPVEYFCSPYGYHGTSLLLLLELRQRSEFFLQVRRKLDCKGLMPALLHCYASAKFVHDAAESKSIRASGKHTKRPKYLQDVLLQRTWCTGLLGHVQLHHSPD